MVSNYEGFENCKLTLQNNPENKNKEKHVFSLGSNSISSFCKPEKNLRNKK